MNFVFGGTPGIDQLPFTEISSGAITLTTIELNGSLVNSSEDIAGISGRIIVFTGSGDDVVSATFLANIALEATGGNGNDLLLGGEADDVLVGGDGNDTIMGNKGDDTIWADSVDGAEGATGDDIVLGGFGDDLIVGDGSEGGADFLYGNNGGDSAGWARRRFRRWWRRRQNLEG